MVLPSTNNTSLLPSSTLLTVNVMLVMLLFSASVTVAAVKMWVTALPGLFKPAPSVNVLGFAVSVSSGASLTGVTVTVLTSGSELSVPSFTVKLILRELPGLSEVLMNMTALNACCHSAGLSPEAEVKVKVRVDASNAEALILPMPDSPAGKLSVSPVT